MGLRDIAPRIDADNRDIVMADTWGHLAPTKNRSYRGRIVYAIGCYDSGELNPTVLVSEFPGLSDSPWLYDAIYKFLDSISWEPEREFPPRQGHGNVGCVYEWKGTFKNYKFVGTVNVVWNPNKPI